MGCHFLNPKIAGFDVKRPPILVYVKRGSTWQLGALEWVFPSMPTTAPLPGRSTARSARRVTTPTGRSRPGIAGSVPEDEPAERGEVRFLAPEPGDIARVALVPESGRAVRGDEPAGHAVQRGLGAPMPRYVVERTFQDGLPMERFLPQVGANADEGRDVDPLLRERRRQADVLRATRARARKRSGRPRPPTSCRSTGSSRFACSTRTTATDSFGAVEQRGRPALAGRLAFWPSSAAGRSGCRASARPTRRRAPSPRRSRPSRR